MRTVSQSETDGPIGIALREVDSILGGVGGRGGLLLQIQEIMGLRIIWLD